MASGKVDANWSADPKDPIQQPALNLIVIDKSVNTDPVGGEGGGGLGREVGQIWPCVNSLELPVIRWENS